MKVKVKREKLMFVSYCSSGSESEEVVVRDSIRVEIVLILEIFKPR